MSSRYSDIETVLGTGLLSDVHNSPLLVVGAGGIGCELLKNLVLSGFHNIEIIDLDTIDLSNLNRQFLFRKQHIGQSKAQIARETALEFNKNCNIIAHHGNIKDQQFGPEYFSKFKLVLMALDNIEARKHVNRICLAVNKPVIESGTAGYLGQVQVIYKDHFECYECRPLPKTKTYAYCTIHNTPSKPIHCIIWGKIKFTDHFCITENTADEEEDLSNDPVMVTEEAELEKLKETSIEKWLFRKLFHRDLLKRIRIAEISKKDIFNGKKAPSPIIPPEISIEKDYEQLCGGLKDQQTWSFEENVKVFYESTKRLFARYKESGNIEWDKDDDDALNFVVSASNLRSHIFGIQLLSRFDCKAMAGNIIPAIATTNAIIAGLIVLEAFKILANRLNECKYTYLLRRPSGNRLLMDVPLEPPSANCYICSSKQAKIQLDTEKCNIGFFVKDILMKELGMVHPSIYSGPNNIYECSEDMDEDEIEEMKEQEDKTLSQVGITHNSLIRVDDDFQNITLEISIYHHNFIEEDASAEEAAPKFKIFKGLEQVPAEVNEQKGEDIVLNKRSREQFTDESTEETQPQKIQKIDQ